MSTPHVDLASMRLGQRGTIVTIQGGLGVTKRLDGIGIRPGVVLKKISGLPFGGPAVVRVGNARIAVGFGVARKVFVEIAPQQDER